MADSAIQEVVCCVAQPAAGNPTQFMLQRALADAGLDWCCLTLEVSPDDLPDAIRGIRAFGFRGANLNYPHKVAAVPLVDSLSESAELMGAINCIHRVGDELVGENTDGPGFVEAISEVCDVTGKRVLLLGAGGSARAISVQLGRSGVAAIHVANRTLERAEQLVDLLQQRVGVAAETVPWEEPLVVPEDIDLLINATSIGHLDADAEIPLQVESLRDSLIVADIVVNPPATWLLNVAAERGCTTLNGLSMLVNQAVRGFKLWTGQDPNPAVMREAVEEFLEV